MKEGPLISVAAAARDITFTDDHHELEQVNLAVYPPVGESRIRFCKQGHLRSEEVCHYVFGNVRVETKDALKVSTETIAYDQNSEIAQTERPISFDRENVSGHSTGAVVESKTKKLESKKDVEITVAPEALKDRERQAVVDRSRPVTIRSAHASFEQETMKMISPAALLPNKTAT